MKPIVLVFVLVAGVVLGGLFVNQHHKAQQAKAEVERAEKEARDAAQRAAAEMGKQVKDLASRLARAEAEAANSSFRAAQPEQSSPTARRPAEPPPPTVSTAEPDSPKKKGLSLIGELLNDPEMREMIRSQSKASRGPAVDSAYGSVLKQMNLTPEQSDKVKELLKGKLGVATELGMNFLAPDMTPEKQKELAALMKEQTDGYNAQIRQLLGDQDYQRLEFYEKSQPERQAMNGFRQQLPSNAAMTPTQEQQLMQAMFDERKNFRFTTDFYAAQQAPRQNLGELLTDERLATFAKEQEQLNQLNLIKARQILTADQLLPFQEHQKNQLEMQMNMMKVGAKVFRGFGGGKLP